MGAGERRGRLAVPRRSVRALARRIWSRWPGGGQRWAAVVARADGGRKHGRTGHWALEQCTHSERHRHNKRRRGRAAGRLCDSQPRTVADRAQSPLARPGRCPSLTAVACGFSPATARPSPPPLLHTPLRPSPAPRCPPLAWPAPSKPCLLLRRHPPPSSRAHGVPPRS